MVKKLLTGVILVAAVLASFSAGCREYRILLDDYLEKAHRMWGFDGIVLVAKDGQIIYCEGFGMANQAMQQPNTPETKFFIGSISKQFTAAAILALVEDGRLSLDQPITDFITDYPVNIGGRITIRHLLTHSSGIPNYTDSPELLLERTRHIEPDRLVERFKNQPLEFEPGTSFKYSNSGYILLGRIIEVASGQSYEAYLHHRILKPAGMTETGYGRRAAAVPNRAEGYTIEDKEVVVPALPIEFSVLYSSGALYSTVTDMLKWDSVLNTDKVISQSSVKTMFTPCKGGYGFGWFIESRYGRRHAFHGGFLDGFNTVFDRWLDDGIAIVVFSNEDEAPVRKIARGIAAILFNQPYVSPLKKMPLEITNPIYTEYEGVYRQANGRYHIVSLEQDTLYIHPQGMPRRTLLPQAPDTFFFACDNTRILVFERDKTSVLRNIVINDEETVIEAVKLSPSEASDVNISRHPVPLDPRTLDSYQGVYSIETGLGNDIAGSLLKVTSLGDKLILSLSENEAIEVFPGAQTRFFHKDADFQITFLLDENGASVGCVLQIGTARLHGLKIK